MQFIRQSSLEEYASWYLHREAAKGDVRPIPIQPEQQIQEMRSRHDGKMRQWFNGRERWHIVEIDVLEDIGNLVFLESDWTKREKLVIPGPQNYRLLSQVATNALADHYLDRLPSHAKHRIYYDTLAKEAMQLRGEDRIAVCSAELSEIKSNPAARFYLLDGVGRCLPYMMLLQEGKLRFTAIEAFIAERET